MKKVKAYISKDEILRITAKKYPNFDKCPKFVVVEVLIKTVDKEKRATLKPLKARKP